MTERPILFSGPMVRAILDGRKTQTRRLLRWPPPADTVKMVRSPSSGRWFSESAPWKLGDMFPGADRPEQEVIWRGAQGVRCTYGQPGERLWVRETWRPAPFHLCGSEGCDCDDVKITYPADGASRVCTMAEGWTPPGGWKRYDGTETCAPSIHMPRWASRLSLEVTSVRVERLQDISGHDILAEGMGQPWNGIGIAAAGGMNDEFQRQLREKFRWLWDEINGDRATWASNPWVWCVGFKRVEVSGG